MKIVNGTSVWAGMFLADDGETYLRLVNTALDEGAWCRATTNAETKEAAFVQIPMELSKELTKALSVYIGVNLEEPKLDA